MRWKALSALSLATVATVAGLLSATAATAVNVKSYGAQGDGVANDLPAIEQALKATPAGGTLYFPAGTYRVSGTDLQGIKISRRQALTLRGEGSRSILQRAGGMAPIRTRIMTATGCRGLAVQDLAFDVNGVERYGGLAVYESQGVRFERCTLRDSRLKGTWSDYDHYGLVIQTTEDVTVTGCTATDVELIEADNCRRVAITDSVVTRAAGTCAIGWFAGGSGNFAEDYQILRNRILDPRKQGVAVVFETQGPNNNRVRRVRIADNEIRHETLPGRRAILAGYFSGGASSGNVVEDLVVEDNRISTAPGIKRDDVEIWFMTTQAGKLFRRSHVRRNQVTGGLAGLDLRHLADSEIAGNVVSDVVDGIDMSDASGCRMAANEVTATGTAYSFSKSRGGNTITGNLAYGDPTVGWDVSGLQSSDRFTP